MLNTFIIELKIYYKYIIYEHILLARTLFFKVVIGHTNTLKKNLINLYSYLSIHSQLIPSVSQPNINDRKK